MSTIITLAECTRLLKLPDIKQNIVFSSISTDTRHLQPGALYVALRGKQYDGHHFIEVACQKKAYAVISELPLNTSIPCLQVQDSYLAFGQLAQYYARQWTLPKIAITGSCGKTTTKAYLHSILNQMGSVLASPKSFNNRVGVPLTLLALKKHHEFLITEIGANQMHAISYLSQLVAPDVSVIVNVSPAHLEGFGSLEKITQAKTEIFHGLKQGGIAILPISFKTKWPAYLPSQSTLFFGESGLADVYAANIRWNKQIYAAFELVTPQGKVAVSLSLPGKHQVSNALAAASAAITLNIPLEMIKIGLEAVDTVIGRLQIKKSAWGGTIIDDTYNATPQSVYAALSTSIQYDKSCIFVFGDMQELGEASIAYHRQVAQWAKYFGIRYLFAIGRYTKETVSAFGEGAMHFAQRSQLLEHLKSNLCRDSVVLVKGSRGMQMEEVVSDLMQNKTH